jgi:lysophospholipase L1-like esterase
MDYMMGIGICNSIGGGGGAAKPIKWLEDLFTTDLAAGSVNGTLAEPSGHVRTVLDSGNKISLSGGSAVVNPYSTAVYGEPRLSYPMISLSEGLCVDIIAKKGSTGEMAVGVYGLIEYYYDYYYFDYFINVTGAGYTAGTFYNFRIISGTDRIYFFVKGGTQYPSWSLFKVMTSSEETNVYPIISGHTSVDAGVSSVKVFNTTFAELGKRGITINAAPWSLTQPSSDGWIEFSWICAASEVLDIAFRQTDATHRLIARFDVAANTMSIIIDNAGETTLASSAMTCVVGVYYKIIVKFIGTSISVTLSVTKSVSGTSSFNQTATEANVTGFTKGFDLIAWPYTYDDADFTEVSPRKTYNIFAVGDSKTQGASDVNGVIRGGYSPLLCSMINGNEVPDKIGINGMQTATLKTNIDTYLAARAGIPDYVLYNMGTNDSPGFDATWITNTGYILDAIHTKYPTAKIYCVVTWLRSTGAAGNTAHRNALTTVLSTRSSFASFGIDELTVLEAGDDGVTYTQIDGVHPNRAGYKRTALAWKTILGL